MNALIKLSAIAALCMTASACGPKPTPVTAAPASTEEAASLQKNLVGKWSCTHTKVGEGAKQTQPMNVEMTFAADGTYLHRFSGTLMIPISKNYTYRLDGKNLVTNSPHGTYRVDAVAANSLELFNYDSSTTWFYTH